MTNSPDDEDDTEHREINSISSIAQVQFTDRAGPCHHRAPGKTRPVSETRKERDGCTVRQCGGGARAFGTPGAVLRPPLAGPPAAKAGAQSPAARAPGAGLGHQTSRDVGMSDDLRRRRSSGRR